MGNVCCGECRGWCKSFTKTETSLVILESILLVILISFLIFLIMHFIACANRDASEEIITTTTERRYQTEPDIVIIENAHETESEDEQSEEEEEEEMSHDTSVSADKMCTWKPSEKTRASTLYYFNNHISMATELNAKKYELFKQMFGTDFIKKDSTTESFEDSDKFDEENDEDAYKNHVLALVKFRANRDITFACILTIISSHWTITAASCIGSIEKVDSLDSFVMMEGYGELRPGRTHSLADVKVHPQYQGANKSYDLAVLKSKDRLVKGVLKAVELAGLLDHLLVTIGESFTILGYGTFRSTNTSRSGRSLRRVYVHTLPGAQCGGGAAARAACAGVLRARSAACRYCAGTPMLRGVTLYGLMSHNPQCGVTCEPALYVSVAAARSWLQYIIVGD